MSNVTYFVRECPTCGRRLLIRVEFLGKRVVCQHCRGEFAAYDPASRRDTELDDNILARAEQLLQTNTRGVVYSRHPHPF
jgi:hypothetical protein